VTAITEAVRLMVSAPCQIFCCPPILNTWQNISICMEVCYSLRYRHVPGTGSW